tara:strand:- start:3785 stop:3928 length:144 start_codon:yes stop_codon:yes gene_type:complete
MSLCLQSLGSTMAQRVVVALWLVLSDLEDLAQVKSEALLVLGHHQLE